VCHTILLISLRRLSSYQYACTYAQKQNQALCFLPLNSTWPRGTFLAVPPCLFPRVFAIIICDRIESLYQSPEDGFLCTCTCEHLSRVFCVGNEAWRHAHVRHKQHARKRAREPVDQPRGCVLSRNVTISSRAPGSACVRHVCVIHWISMGKEKHRGTKNITRQFLAGKGVLTLLRSVSPLTASLPTRCMRIECNEGKSET
jgi:hypothetical protein